MSSFRFVPLLDLIKNIKVGFVGSIDKYYCNEEDGVLLLRTSNLTDNGIDYSDVKYVTHEFFERNKKSQLHKNDILIARHGDNGKANIYLFDRPAQALNVVIIEPDETKLSANMIKYFFESPFVQKQINGNVGGSVQGVINTKQIAELKIPYCDKLFYEKIDNLLSEIESKIDNNNLINNELESMARTIYDYWFLQFEFPNEEGKPYKSSGGKMVWNEELKREIPEGWEVSQLKDKYSIERGLSYTSKDIESGVGVPMINLACIDINRNYRDGELKYHNGNVPDSAKLNSEDLLVACTDLTRNADIVGSPILTPNDDKTYTYSMDIAKLVPDERYFNKFYLYMALRTDFYHNYIKKWASGTNVLHLNLEGISWYNTWIPPMGIQNKFALIVEDIHKKKCEILLENQELASLRDFLLPMLMNGQIGFKDGE